MAAMLSWHAMPWHSAWASWSLHQQNLFLLRAQLHTCYILNPLPTIAIANLSPPHLTSTLLTRAPLSKLASWGWITGAHERLPSVKLLGVVWRGFGRFQIGEGDGGGMWAEGELGWGGHPAAQDLHDRSGRVYWFSFVREADVGDGAQRPGHRRVWWQDPAPVATGTEVEQSHWVPQDQHQERLPPWGSHQSIWPGKMIVRSISAYARIPSLCSFVAIFGVVVVVVFQIVSFINLRVNDQWSTRAEFCRGVLVFLPPTVVMMKALANWELPKFEGVM